MLTPISPQGPLAGFAMPDAQPAVVPLAQTNAAPPPPQAGDTGNRTGRDDAQNPRAQREADARKRSSQGGDQSLARSVVEGKIAAAEKADDDRSTQRAGKADDDRGILRDHRSDGAPSPVKQASEE